MTWDEVCALGLRLPGVTASLSYGEPSLKIRIHLLTRLRAADQSLVLLDVPPGEREMLTEAADDIFFSEPHYQNYPIVLARLTALDAATLRPFLERRWRARASKAMILAFDR